MLRKFPKRGTIGHLVLTTLAKQADVTSEQLGKRIKKRWPDSAWNPAHLAWYRYQVKQGNYILPKTADEAVEQADK